MELTHAVFDLDETLYPREAGLMQEIARRITLWMEREMAFSAEEASTLRRRYLQQYGTTLAGLTAEHDVDVEAYLDFVHDIPVERYLRPNPDLVAMLTAIPLRRVIYTNATVAHAERVLRVLGLDGQFEHLIGIREVNLCNKPRIEGYQRMLSLVDARGPACVLVDDRAVNLLPGARLGMTTVLLDAPLAEGVDYVVRDVLEVGELIARLMEDGDGSGG